MRRLLQIVSGRNAALRNACHMSGFVFRVALAAEENADFHFRYLARWGARLMPNERQNRLARHGIQAPPGPRLPEASSKQKTNTGFISIQCNTGYRAHRAFG
jgi:hypothetical protein